MLGVELDKALGDCTAALKLSNGSPEMFASRGLVRYRMGDLDGAIADYDSALKLNNAPWPLYGRGLAKLKKGMAAEGAADIAAAKALSPAVVADATKRGLKP